MNIDFKSKKSKEKVLDNPLVNLFVQQEVDLYCMDFLESDCDNWYKFYPTNSKNMHMCIQDSIFGRLIKIKRTNLSNKKACMSILEVSSEKNILQNGVNLSINDPVSKILDNYHF